MMFGLNSDWVTDTFQNNLNDKLFDVNNKSHIEFTKNKRKRKHTSDEQNETSKNSIEDKTKKSVDVIKKTMQKSSKRVTIPVTSKIEDVFRKDLNKSGLKGENDEFLDKKKKKRKERKYEQNEKNNRNKADSKKIERQMNMIEDGMKVHNNFHEMHQKNESKMKDTPKKVIAVGSADEAEKCSKNMESEHKPLNKNKTSKYNKFQLRLNKKLKGGHFRWINEKLYTSHSTSAAKMFEENSALFEVYHDGFSSQVQHWSQNPVDIIIDDIKQRMDYLVIADFGCGSAQVSKAVPNVVYSFDLVAMNDKVTACDMRKVPLEDNCVDIAIFCLSLMGTNSIDFIIEARRVLKAGGLMKIAEVKSRFEDIASFVENIELLGFRLVARDDANKMFVVFDFEKLKKSSKACDVTIALKPCIYKRR